MALLSLFFLSVFAILQTTLGRATFTVDNLGISGGQKILISDAPYMAGLFDDAGQICGGSIIHEKFILTSALCANGIYPIIKVHIGSKHVNDSGIFINIDKELCHEDYNQFTFENDICLLKLRDPITFSGNIAKVELPRENLEIVQGTMVNITGWGNKDDEHHHFPKFLQQATISVLPNKDCHHIDSRMTGKMLCAGWEGRYTCDRDGGGPLTRDNVQVGILTLQRSICGFRPSFYTKVSKYIYWIHNTIRLNL